ncbi:bile acid:sodium symporter [Vibrio sp. DNB22_10_4]|jgi:sodium/bile acid cotransporter 7
MAKILFAGNPALGLIVLPTMIYHQLQLIVCSALARKYADRMARAEASTGAPASRPA